MERKTLHFQNLFPFIQEFKGARLRQNIANEATAT